MNVAVNHKKRPVSLIPYLKPGNTGFYIDLTPGQNGDAAATSFHSVFQVVSEPTPFSRIVYARIVEKGAKTVEPALLLTQKDHYGSAADMNPPGNPVRDNEEIDRDWQAAFSYYSQSRLIRPPLIIKEQVTADGKLARFKPLWYCRYKQSFFHPPCPLCGADLNECHDDDLLIKSGLHPFFASAQRYLYCPCAIDSAGADHHPGTREVAFYAPFPKTSDPAILKNPDDLIRGFGTLTDQDVPDTHLPCVSCDCHEQCYGKSRMADSRLTFFSFFPFYMIAFNAPEGKRAEMVSAVPEMTDFQKHETSRVKETEKAAAPERDVNKKTPPDIYAAKKEIRRILGNIYRKWQNEIMEPEAGNLTAKVAVSDEAATGGSPEAHAATFAGPDLERTVIISPRDTDYGKIQADLQRTDPEKTVIITKEDPGISEKNTAGNMADSRLEKTVIITADSVEHLASPVSRQKLPAGESGKATLVLKPKTHAEDSEIKKTSMPPRTEDDLEKTVIITPGKSVSPGSQKVTGRKVIFGDDPVGEKYPDQQPASDDTLEKTRIIQPRKHQFHDKNNKNDKKDDG